MRKHNKKFAQRWQRARNSDGELDRSNFPQSMAHRYVHNKESQTFANTLLLKLLVRAGIKSAKLVQVGTSTVGGVA